MKRREGLVALAGNPNVGKSTLFNALTGMRQHTGNWPGKTVTSARGSCRWKGREYTLVDLPGTYSLSARSAEEEVTRRFLQEEELDAAVVVCDATCLERSLNLVFQVLELTGRVVVCVNLLDEAKKKGLEINLERLSLILGVPVVGTSAGRGTGLEELMEAVARVAEGESAPLPRVARPVEEQIAAGEQAARQVVRQGERDPRWLDRRLDQVFTSRLTGIPVMLLLLMGVFWLTIIGANYPSQWLNSLFALGESWLNGLFGVWNAPAWLSGMLVEGVYRVLTWVISVMLPPMAIFFPLFTLLEDFGYLPRVAFVMDHAFQKCRACGKQALTMCMGLGCNAVGVTGCRIIDSPRERLIAILTNCLVPCNGRFPAMIAIITMFFVGTAGSSLLAAAILTGVILFGAAMTFLLSRVLSSTVLKGMPSSFALELPPYRRPQVGKVIVRSVLDRTLFVLGRAAAVAAPAGLLIWLCANVTVGEASILAHCTAALDPFARLLGLDGVILMAFILGWPANEIVLPIVMMAYLANGTLMEWDSLDSLRQLLVENGWTWLTAVCTVLFFLIHWPCSTTCLTIGKETGSVKWTLLAVALPTALGMLVCFLTASLARLLGLAP